MTNPEPKVEVTYTLYFVDRFGEFSAPYGKDHVAGILESLEDEPFTTVTKVEKHVTTTVTTEVPLQEFR